MLGKLIALRRERKAWRRDHIASFNEAMRVDRTGLTSFQLRCVARLVGYVAPQEFIRDFGVNGHSLSAVVRGSEAELTIFDSEATIHGGGHDIRFEEWDFRTSEDLISAVEQALRCLTEHPG